MAKTAAKTSATKVKGARAGNGKTTRTPDARASTTSSAKPVRAATASGNVAAAKAGSPTGGANKPSQSNKSSGSNKSAPKARASAPSAASTARPASKSSAGAVPAAKSAPQNVSKSSAGQVAAAKPASKSSAGSIAAVAAKSSAGQVAAAKPASKSSAGSIAAVAAKSSAGQVAAVAAKSSAGQVAAATPAAREATANGMVAAKQRAEAPLVDVTPVSDVQSPATRAPESKADRPGPKGPTNKNATIDTWAADKLDAAQKSVLDAIRKIVRRVAPQATEAVKWAQPVWERNGPFAFLKPAKNHVTFGFWRGTELPDPKGLLEGAGDRMRHLKIRLGASVPIEQIATFVREAVRRNEAKGDPTKPRS